MTVRPYVCLSQRGRMAQVDGGDTFTEPSCIITGRPERGENVVVRVHDACFTSGARACLHAWKSERTKVW